MVPTPVNLGMMPAAPAERISPALQRRQKLQALARAILFRPGVTQPILDAEALGRLAAALQHPDEEIRQLAAILLWELRPQFSGDLPVWAAILHDPSSGMRLRGVRCLAQYGEAAAQVVPQLARVCRDESVDVQREAVLALGYMGEAAGEAAQALIEPLASEDMRTRAFAAAALRKIGSASIGPLTDALNDRRPMVREKAADILGSIAAGDLSAILALRVATRDPNPEVAAAAAAALRRLQGE